MGSGCQVIVEKGGSLFFKGRCAIKQNSVIYVKRGASLTIGKNSSFGHHTEISVNSLVSIGSDVMGSAYVYITDSNHGINDRASPFRLQEMVSKKTSIGNNVWIGRGSMVLAGAAVSDNSVIGAGAIVTNQFENGKLIAGAAARVIRSL